MPAYDMASAFQVGVDILNSSVASNGTILLQTGDNRLGILDANKVELWQPGGFLSRPSKAVAKGKEQAQALILRRSDNDICFGLRDQRGQDLAGNLGYGETTIYAAGEDGAAQGRVLLKGNGNVAIYTSKGNEEGGTPVTIQANSDGTINIASEFGGISIADGSISLISAAGAGVRLDSSGVTVLGGTVILNGSVMLGDDTATAVATQLSLAPIMTALATVAAGVATCATAIGGLAPVATAATAAATMLGAAASPAPGNVFYSLNTKAS